SERRSVERRSVGVEREWAKRQYALRSDALRSDVPRRSWPLTLRDYLGRFISCPSLLGAFAIFRSVARQSLAAFSQSKLQKSLISFSFAPMTRRVGPL